MLIRGPLLVVDVVERRLGVDAQPVQGDAVIGRDHGPATREGQQQVVVVGDRRRGDRAGPDHVRVGLTGRGVDQLHHLVQVVQPLALAAMQNQALDPSALAIDRARSAAAPPAVSVATASGSTRSGSGVTDSHDARLTMGIKYN